VEDFYMNFSLYELIVFWTLSFALFIQFIYYVVIFIRVPLLNKNKVTYTETKEPVSIIICARNEAENLTAHLPLILEQDYPDYEVIVVNDCSEDESQDILEKFQEKYPYLRLTRIKNDEKFTHGKKLALTIGIKAAKNEWLLLTDADCKPASNQWVTTMQRNFTENTDIVLGYGGYNSEKGFLNKLIRFDTFFIALQYLSYARIGAPYMGVGRNLAYRKSLYLKNKGFASHAHILSGDDDLFINEVANSKNTSVEFSTKAHTRSIPKKNFNLWLSQKTRHLSTGYRYRFVHKLLIGGELFSRFLFYLSIILMLVNPNMWVVGLTAFFIRLLIQLSVLNGAFNKLNEKKLLFASILFDIVIPFINLFLYLIHTINTKQHRWK
jgi:glycosyltransferase involved in cell wall biosynthesis